MKKAITAITTIMFLFLAAFPAIAQDNFVNSTGDLTADALVSAGQGNFNGIVAVTDGTNAITFSVYDNTAASGKKLVSTFIFQATTAGTPQSIGFTPSIRFSNGIYIDITCSGTAHYTAYWSW